MLHPRLHEAMSELFKASFREKEMLTFSRHMNELYDIVTDMEGCPTACMHVTKNKRLQFGYSTKFVDEAQTNNKWTNRETRDFMLLVCVHEVCHTIFGHLEFSWENLSKYYNGIDPSIINLAADMEINMWIYKRARDYKPLSAIPSSVTDYFQKQFVFPQEEHYRYGLERKIFTQQEFDENDGILDIFTWLDVLMHMQKEAMKSPEVQKMLEDLKKFAEDQVAQGKMNSNQGVGSINNNDCLNVGNDGHSIAKGRVQERELIGENLSETNDQIVRRAFSNVKVGYDEFLADFNSKALHKMSTTKDYSKFTKAEIAGVIPEDIRLGKYIPPRPDDSLLFIDVSGSMSFQRLQEVYGLVQHALAVLGTVYYALVDTDIIEDGTLESEETLKHINGGGGTCFEQPTKDLIAKYNPKNIIYYTDGYFSNFEIPEGPDVYWLLVDCNDPENFHMKGEKYKLD